MSIVLPAHDEASTIVEVIGRCRSCTPGLLEIIVVDDGSSDDTARLAAGAGATVLRLGRNRGKGVAIRRALPVVRGEVLVCLDADGQDNPEEIPDLLAALKPDVGLVIGSRFIGTFEPGAITPLNRVGSYLLRSVLNGLFRANITDPFAGFRAFRMSTIEGCTFTAERYDIEQDMLLALLERGVRVVEVPVRRRPRTHGRTGLGPLRDGSRILRRIVVRRLGL